MCYTTMTVLGISFIFIMTLLGALSVFCFKKEIPIKTQAIFLGFAAGVMTAASVWSLLLPAIAQAETDWGDFAVVPAVIGFCLGGVLLSLLDCVTKKKMLLQASYVERKRASRLFFAITLHNIPEGLAVGFAFGAAYAIGTNAAYLTALGLAIGIGLQNLPEGAAVSLSMQTLLKNRGKSFFWGVLSGVCEPIFAVIGYFLARELQIIQPWLLCFSAGAMLFVVAEELFPATEDENCRRKTTWGFMMGFTLMMFLDVVLG